MVQGKLNSPMCTTAWTSTQTYATAFLRLLKASTAVHFMNDFIALLWLTLAYQVQWSNFTFNFTSTAEVISACDNEILCSVMKRVITTIVIAVVVVGKSHSRTRGHPPWHGASTVCKYISITIARRQRASLNLHGKTCPLATP